MVDVESGPIVPILTPSCSASNSRANAAALSSTLGIIELGFGVAWQKSMDLGRRWRGRVCLRPTCPLFFDRGTDVAHRCARRMHLHRSLGHLEADGALHAMLLPFDDVGVHITRLDET